MEGETVDSFLFLEQATPFFDREKIMPIWQRLRIDTWAAESEEYTTIVRYRDYYNLSK